MRKMVIFGAGSEIGKCLEESRSGQVVKISKNDSIFGLYNDLLVKYLDGLFLDNSDIVYISSVLYSKQAIEQNEAEGRISFNVNFRIPSILINYLNTKSNNYNFCFVSSESASKGSYDDTYAGMKRGVELLIEETKLQDKDSRIFAIAPSTISDAAMTTARRDKDRLECYLKRHPKSRFLTSKEVAVLINDLMSTKYEYLSNTVVRLNGGKFARKG